MTGSDTGPTAGAELRLSRRLAFMHVGGILGLILVVAATILYVSGEHNRLAHTSSVALVESGVEAFRSKMRTVVKDYSIWDEAYAAVQAEDLDWLYRNIGTGASEIGALDVIVVVDPARGRATGWRAGSPVEGEAGLVPAPVLATVLDELSRTVPIEAIAGAQIDQDGQRREAASLFAEVNGELWVFAATRIRPLAGFGADVDDASVPRQVHGLRVGGALLSVLHETLLIDDLAAVAGPVPEAGAREGAALAAVALRGADGQPVGHIVWSAPRPGDSILRQIAVPLGVALAVATLLAALTSGSLVRGARQLERALVAAQAADRSKTEFLSNVSHELRTPMNGIIGAAQLLEMTELSEEKGRFVQILRTSSRLQMALISDLIDLTQIESGNRALAGEPFEPEAVARDVLEIVRPGAEEKGLHLAAQLDALDGLTVRGDERALRQILLNLAGNAAKFTREGTVTIDANRQDQDGLARLAFRVADTGPGIDPAHHRAIFTRFYQVDSTATRQAEGTGLGLAISASLAAMMGGTLEVESAPGRGSVFTLSVALPLVGSEPGARPAAADGAGRRAA
jgi:signal transduction histidine kinase